MPEMTLREQMLCMLSAQSEAYEDGRADTEGWPPTRLVAYVGGGYRAAQAGGALRGLIRDGLVAIDHRRGCQWADREVWITEDGERAWNSICREIG